MSQSTPDLPVIETSVRYDGLNGYYIIEKTLGTVVIGEPVVMSLDEYIQYRLRQNRIARFKVLNSGEKIATAGPAYLSLLDKRSRSKGGRSVFGPGGIQLTTQGTMNVSAGLIRDVTDNPALPQRARTRNRFDFDQQIQLNLRAKVGDRIDFNLNYDSEATFDLDAKQLKLSYKGDEDDIIQHIEAGNVSMTTGNSLINGGAALFGIKTDLQFGKLEVNTLLSRQQSVTQTVNSSGATQTVPFEFRADQYEENRHFFLGNYFRNRYDDVLGQLPYVESPITITRIEVWITNKQGNYDQARNLLAFADLGEHNQIYNSLWAPQGTEPYPHNRANTLYELLVTQYSAARDINNGSALFPAGIQDGQDYEKIENARLLNSSEYTFQPKLGYLSLQMPLQSDEVLAVAFEYTCNGKVYQVGEFSEDAGGGVSNEALFVKLLKPVSFSPQSYTWDLMMKNIYPAGSNAYRLEQDGFKLQITFISDTIGTSLTYLPDSGIEGKRLLQIMNLDRLNERNQPYPDGLFDFVEGYTIDSENGRIIFPVVEPFGSHLKQAIGNDVLAEHFVFQELYDSTLTVARQLEEKNKFRMTGEFIGASSGEIDLNATNIPRGSVKVTAGGILLTEGVDYTVDYLSGRVRILNSTLISNATPVNVSFENQTVSQLQRKTLSGINLLYHFSENFSAGTTLMHYTEKPMVAKSAFGEEPANNVLWGVNLNYRKESDLVTQLLDELPFTDAKAPSMITANAEFAQLIPGQTKNGNNGGYSYIDDFETSTSGIDLSSPQSWSLAATPYSSSATALFPEAGQTNHTEYGNNRALLAWFSIDGMFTQRNSSLTPTHIKNDLDQLSDHRVREIYEREVFPNRETYLGQPATIPVLNLSFYPNERGPYNLDTNVDSEGKLLDPQKRWGGITRQMDIQDFEASNIEYIEFWVMDPFASDSLGLSAGGDLYINLGNVSEEILKDGKKFFENGLPVDDDTTAVGYSVWGKYPKQTSTVYAFDNSLGEASRRKQDVGLNGLSTEEEHNFPTYQTYLEELQRRLPAETVSRLLEDEHSPLNDPAGDNFRHYRGAEQDRRQLSILERYKYYNGTEGNSVAQEGNENYISASKTSPDVEDINNDNTLNEKEAYYQYKISLRREDLQAGSNYISDQRETSVKLRNGKEGKITWYQFKIPIREYLEKTGNIDGFNNIRFMRMFLTGFEEPIFLRFATLELKRSEWRNFENDLTSGDAYPGTGKLEVSTVNIEENGRRSPVNYVLPPEVTRILDPGQPQLRQENEQSLALKITDLGKNESLAIYKNGNYDLRRYNRLQMFVHAERTMNDPGTLQDGDFSLFIRLGSDYRNNYYEYEIPLQLTPSGEYNTYLPDDQEKVWPSANMLDIPLNLLTELKQERNNEKQQGNASYFTLFSKVDPERQANRVSIMGNPSLSDIKVWVIGIRNKTDDLRSAEVWVNELRMGDFDEKGGWAAQGNVQLSLSDIGTIALSARKETAGFGAVNQRLQERRDDDFTSLYLAMNLELGRFAPKNLKLSVPFHLSYSDEKSSPLYDPFDQDLLLSESLKSAQTQSQRDSIRNIAATGSKILDISLDNVKMNIRSKQPMPYDPANFSLSFSHSKSIQHNPETEYALQKNFRLSMGYEFTPQTHFWEPFKNNTENGSGKHPALQMFHFNFLPNNIRFHSDLNRFYEETQIRDLDAMTTGIPSSREDYLTFRHNFLWNRDFSLEWNLTRNLKSSFRSGTVAEIEEPYLQVNKKLNQSDYELWKDSVVRSIRELGKPLSYEQTADITWTLPFSSFPSLNWIVSSAAYHSQYSWERGAVVEDKQTGNYLQNDMTLTLNGRFNFATLYQKSPFLRNYNQKDDNKPDEKGFDHILRKSAIRALTMIRNISIHYGYKTRNDIYGFESMPGDFLGQSQSSHGLLPGWKFAFGLEGGEAFIEQLKEKSLLVLDENNLQPAIHNRTQSTHIEALLEPFPGIALQLNALYEKNHRNEIQYLYDDMPVQRGGSFAMSIVSLRSAFDRSSAKNGYHSKTFDQFIKNSQVIADRTRDNYRESRYPVGGFLTGSGYEGLPFDSDLGDVSSLSADVLIPAFLAAYTGQNPSSTQLTPFPDLSALLPNWRIICNATKAFTGLRDYLQSLTFTHQYLSQYRIGSFNSYSSWVPLTNGSELGFVRDAVTGLPRPSLPYSISSASIQESFNPLVEMQGTLMNNLTLLFRINRSRSINLNITSRQIVETNDRDYVTGLGYRISDFGQIIGLKNNRQKKNRLTAIQAKQPEVSENEKKESSNDLVLRLDLSQKTTHALIRRIEGRTTQATSGIRTTAISFSADYTLSQSITIRAFFDKTIYRPLVSSGSYPTSTTSSGMSILFNMNP